MSDTGNAFDRWMTEQLHNKRGSMSLAEWFALNAETDEDTNTESSN